MKPAALVEADVTHAGFKCACVWIIQYQSGVTDYKCCLLCLDNEILYNEAYITADHNYRL